eukprot:Skav219351  [mRNA]  locus=scaffold76:450367:450650:- [translate_table: standard]
MDDASSAPSSSSVIGKESDGNSTGKAGAAAPATGAAEQLKPSQRVWKVQRLKSEENAEPPHTWLDGGGTAKRSTAASIIDVAS